MFIPRSAPPNDSALPETAVAVLSHVHAVDVQRGCTNRSPVRPLAGAGPHSPATVSLVRASHEKHETKESPIEVSRSRAHPWRARGNGKPDPPSVSVPESGMAGCRTEPLVSVGMSFIPQAKRPKWRPWPLRLRSGGVRCGAWGVSSFRRANRIRRFPVDASYSDTSWT